MTRLREDGVVVSLTQDGSAIPLDCDLFVYSEAIPEGSPERMRARELSIPSMSYFHALGTLTQESTVIAVCGTHGKSSTTAMAARVLIDAKRDPSVIVGTKMQELTGRNWRKGASDLFLVEACEYRRSFHFLSPDIVVLTNADGDHFDAFASLEDYRSAFVTFLKRLPQEGVVITHGADPVCSEIVRASGRILVDADEIPLPVIQAPGLHMRQNARLALALSRVIGVEPGIAEESLRGFQGTWRRMEVKGQRADGVTVIDDYAHHPVEIQATLAAMREAYPSRPLICVFQPHTHERTRSLYEAFCTSFKLADLVIVPGIYNARSDRDTQAVDPAALAVDIGKGSAVRCVYVDGLAGALAFLDRELKAGDVCITMGAGDVTELSTQLLTLTDRR